MKRNLKTSPLGTFPVYVIHLEKLKIETENTTSKLQSVSKNKLRVGLMKIIKHIITYVLW